MKPIIRFVLVICILILFISAGLNDTQKPKWKGKIEYENGVKVIKNPMEPLYGEITLELEEDLSIGSEDKENYMFYRDINFDIDKEGNILVLDYGNCRIQKYDRNGEYLQTIGKKGQGPGEFVTPLYFHLDDEDKIYVQDNRLRIHLFTKKGEFIKTIKLSSSIMDFGITNQGDVFAYTTPTTPEGKTDDIVLFNSGGKKTKVIMSFPTQRNIIVIRFVGIGFSNPYSPRLCFSPLSNGGIIFGYSSEYKLFVINSRGEISFVIEKDELPDSIPKKEINRIIDGFIERIKKHNVVVTRDEVKKAYDFRKCKPFYSQILNDDRENMYVRKVTMNISQAKNQHYDLFSKSGHYLYKVKVPILERIKIKSGFIYCGKKDSETGYSYMKRYKIKNWDRIRDGI